MISSLARVVSRENLTIQGVKANFADMNKICLGVLIGLNMVVYAWGADPGLAKKIELTQDFTPSVKSGPMDLWVPVPMDLPGYQKVIAQTYSGNASRVSTEGDNHFKMLHAHWERVSSPEFHVKTQVELLERISETQDAAEQVSRFLQPTAHVQTDGIVRETAANIIHGLKTSDEKAQSIYQWVVEKSVRDPQVRGCGVGDVKSLLLLGKIAGKCADLNSLFVGLARAAGVPAREVFGIRVAPSELAQSLGKVGDVSKGQHCRAEYHSDSRKAWIPVDPADVRKAILEEKLNLDSPQIEKIRNRFFGHWEENWIALNFARDFLIRTDSTEEKINYFMYPLLRAKNVSPDGMDPAAVSYKITSALR